jgi:hypothetical protein
MKAYSNWKMQTVSKENFKSSLSREQKMYDIKMNKDKYYSKSNYMLPTRNIQYL